MTEVRTRRPGTVMGITLLLLSTSAAMLADPADAQIQEITFQVLCPEGPETIQPLGPPGVWSCTADLYYKSAGSGLTDPTQPGIIEIQAEGVPEWMDVVISPSTMAFLGPGYGSETVQRPVQVAIALDASAPAYTPTEVRLVPTIVQNPRDGASEFVPLVNALTVTPGYVNLYTARLSHERAEAWPQESVSYGVTIDNYSNGPTRFTFSMPGEPPEGHQPVIPEPLVIDGRTENGTATRGQTVFQVLTPYRNGYLDERAALQLRIDSAYGVDPTLTGPSTLLTTLTETKGFYVPSPAVPAVALALAIACLLPARRRV